MNILRSVLRLILGRRLAVTSGTVKTAGPRGSISIRRDKWGIPVVEAGSDHDAWFGLGFCHGQDRPLQLEMLARLSRGTLAEMVGPPAIGMDRLTRRVGFLRAAESQWEVLAPDIRAVVEGYVLGVNAGATAGLRSRPHEFALLRHDFTPWVPLDVLASFKLQSFLLPSNWDVELARLQILRLDGPEALAALDPTYPEWQHVTDPPLGTAGRAINRLADDLKSFAKATGFGGGSNNWVIGAGRTATGRPLVANDPHLSPMLPNHWYLAHVRAPGWAVCGASFVGAPSFPSAHNGHAAWGITAGLIDNTDLFVESIGPDGKSCRQGDTFVSCEVRHETIHVRGGESVTEDVLITPRGPLLTGVFDGVTDAVSIRATWLERRPMRGLLDAPKARTFADFRAAFADWPAMPLNVVYADAEGTIGWQLAGNAPVRKSGWHLLPLQGWISNHDWEPECVPFRTMPTLENPERGWIATANNRPEPEGQGPYLGSDFLDGYRLGVIVEQLARHDRWTVEQCSALQTSQVSLPWREMREVVLGLPSLEPDAMTAQKFLRDWDGILGPESYPATLYELFVANLTARIVRAKAPQAFEWAMGRGGHVLGPVNFFAKRRMGQLVALLREQPGGWFADGWPAEIGSALAAAFREYGTLRDQRWGYARPLVLSHMLFGEVRPWSGVFNLGPLATGGDDHTPNQASLVPLEPLEPSNNVAGLRAVFDVGGWGNSRFVIAGGQSGNPMSPHYGDLLEVWRRGEGVPIPWTADEIAKATVATLNLEPG